LTNEFGSVRRSVYNERGADLSFRNCGGDRRDFLNTGRMVAAQGILSTR
jgi:hypothetical protein